MAVTVATLGTRMTSAVAATVATAIGGGTTAAEVTALAQFLVVAGTRPGETTPLLKLANNTQLIP